MSSFATRLILLLIALSFSGPGLAKSRDPIRIGLDQQTSQKAMAHISARVLKRAGFKSEFVELRGGQIEMLSSGAAHFNPAFVAASETDAFKKASADSSIISLGGLHKNEQSEAKLKIIWAGVHRKWPYAERMLKTMIVPSEDLEMIAKTVDSDGVPLDEAVDKWMNGNKSKWKRWLSASTNWMKP